jgi:hypothetical protein
MKLGPVQVRLPILGLTGPVLPDNQKRESLGDRDSHVP